jgi:hypothetical protein
VYGIRGMGKSLAIVEVSTIQLKSINQSASPPDASD